MGVNVVYISGRDDTQSDFAIDAAKGEVVDLVTEGRYVGALGGVYLDREDVISVGVEVFSEFKRERRETSSVFTEQNSVDPDG